MDYTEIQRQILMATSKLNYSVSYAEGHIDRNDNEDIIYEINELIERLNYIKSKM